MYAWREKKDRQTAVAPPTQIPEQKITEPQEVWTVFVVVGRQLEYLPTDTELGS